MKITKLGFQKTIKTDQVIFSILEEGKIISRSVKFKAVVFSNEPIHTIWIGTEPSKIMLEYWFNRMLHQKLILVEPSNAQDYFEEHLFVKNTDLPYITETLFQILERLLPKELTLLSIEII